MLLCLESETSIPRRKEILNDKLLELNNKKKEIDDRVLPIVCLKLLEEPFYFSPFYNSFFRKLIQWYNLLDILDIMHHLKEKLHKFMSTLDDLDISTIVEDILTS